MDIVGILGRIGFDFKVFLFNLINFIIVALILQKFVFKKISDVLETRKKIVDEGIANAEQAALQIKNANEEHTKIITEARSQANSIVGEAVNQAKAEAELVTQNTITSLEKLQLESKNKIKEERESMVKEFSQEASELVVLATEKLLKDKIEVSQLTENKASKSIEEVKSHMKLND